MINKCPISLVKLLIGLSISTVSSIAQTTPIEPEEATSIKAPLMRALAIGLQDELSELEILDAKLQSVATVNLRKFKFSSPFRCPIVNGKLVFGVQSGVNEEGIPVYKPVAVTDWDRSMAQSCLIFIPMQLRGGSDNGIEYAIHKLDMSQSSFDRGHTKVLNFTPFDTIMQMGEHKAATNAWGTSNVPEVKELGRMNMAQIGVFYKYNNSIRNPFQTQIRYLDQTRYLAIIYPDLVNKEVGVKIVKDYGKLFK